MTSLLRELVTVPNASARSTTIVSRPERASARPTASPTTPAPITTASMRSMRARSSLRRVLRDPRGELRHIAGEEGARALVADLEAVGDQPWLVDQVHLGRRQQFHVAHRDDMPQVRLRHRRADRAATRADDACGLAGPRA